MAEKGNGLAICALVFSVIFGLVGLILGIAGQNSYEEGSTGKTICNIAVVISCINMFLALCLFM